MSCARFGSRISPWLCVPVRHGGVWNGGVHRGVFADRMTYATAMAMTAVTVFTLGAIAAWAGKERHSVAFGE
jgi:hypothetical protein